MKTLPLCLLSALVGAMLSPLSAQTTSKGADERLAAFHGGDAWRTFLDQVGGEWRVEWCAATGTPRAIHGSGMALSDWRENTLEEARRHALAILQKRGDLLGLGTSEFRESIGARMGRTWSFVFDQWFRGLPVIGGRADVRVNMVGRVPLFGSTAFRIEPGFDVVPAIDAEHAVAIAWQHDAAPGTLPTGEMARAGRLVIWGDVHAATAQTPRLAWEVTIHELTAGGAGRIQRCYVDAKNGSVLHVQNDKHACGAGCGHEPSGGGGGGSVAAPAPTVAAPLPVPTTVVVSGWLQNAVDASASIGSEGLPRLAVSVPGVGNFMTDENCAFTMNIASPVSFTIAPLDGRHYRPISGSNVPPSTFTISPGGTTYIYIGSPFQGAAETAHLNSAYWIDRANAYARRVIGDTPQLELTSSVGVNVNIAQTCNAFYDAPTNTLNFYAAGGGCANSAFSSVIVHEWGHGLDTQYGGASQVQGLSESWADTLAMYVMDQPAIGSGFITTGVPLRTGTNTVQYPFGSPDVHEQGQPFMGFAWKLRERLAATRGSRATAIAVTEDIVIGSIVANATDPIAAVLEIFVADDNDGDLLNGTPHAAELVWACQQHSLSYPAPAGVPNDACTYALDLVAGLNGPFTNTATATSAPAWPCAVITGDVWFRIPIANPGTLSVSTCGQATWDTGMQLFSGSCGSLVSVACVDDSCSLQTTITAAVQPGTYYLRVGGYQGANGTFNLSVSGPLGGFAAASQFGVACGGRSRGFYEYFQPGAVDLANTSFRLVPSGNHYIVQPGGSFVAPTAAAAVANLGNESEGQLTINSTFTFPGGSSNVIAIHSNGFVSAGAGNLNNSLPYLPGWHASTAPRWGLCHDFDPSLGAGRVKYQFVGAVLHVTYENVQSRGGGAPHTFQLQLDFITGIVTFAIGAFPGDQFPTLVGYAAAGASTDAGPRDLSATIAATFVTSDVDHEPMVVTATLPRLGTTLTLTTTFASTSVLGLQVLGLTRLDPGVPLDALGMPGCFQYVSLDVMNVLFPVARQASYTLPIPTTASLVGFQMTAQSVAFDAVNTAGLVTSRGIAIAVGL